MLSLELLPILLDYELPGHPRELGRGHVGAIVTPTLSLRFGDLLAIDAGVLARLPFAHDFEEEIDAAPILALALRPFQEDVVLRLGMLDLRHGFHPALLDEDRYAYGRPYEETYNRSITEGARRDLGGDPFVPLETGVQLVARLAPLVAEAHIDWQLLETETHREKFAFGLLGGYEGPWLDAGFQLRVVHYGGQLFTQRDPIRRAGLDPKRQPITLAFLLTPKPIAFRNVAVELPLAFVHGRAIQTPGGRAVSHFGFEAGADVLLFGFSRLGYRFWLPKDGEARFLAEDSDPTYSGPRAHRATVAVGTTHGPARLEGRLDLVFAEGAGRVQYLTVTTLRFEWELVLLAWTADEE